jgi:hypothetical protein
MPKQDYGYTITARRSFKTKKTAGIARTAKKFDLAQTFLKKCLNYDCIFLKNTNTD